MDAARTNHIIRFGPLTFRPVKGKLKKTANEFELPLQRNFRFTQQKGSLSTRVFETRTATGREQFAFLDRIVSQIFILFISNGEQILNNVNVVV